MTADDYATLMDFLATRFARMDAAFAAMEARLTRAEVMRESMRDELRRVAEGVVAVNERVDSLQLEARARLDEHDRRFDRIDARLDEHDRRFDGIDARLDEHDRRFDRIDARLDEHDRRFDRIDVQLEEQGRRFDGLDRGLGGVQVQFDRFAVDFGTVQLDHGARIGALERHRKRRDSEA